MRPALATLAVLLLLPAVAHAAPAVSVGDTRAREGDGTATFRLRLSEPPAAPVRVGWSLRDSEALLRQDVIGPYGGEVTFAAGATEQLVVVELRQDPFDEYDERFGLVLGGVSGAGATIADGLGVATILDDDPPPVLEAEDARATEGGTMTFDLRLSTPSGKILPLLIETRDGSAIAGEDYTARRELVFLGPGERGRRVTVDLRDDDVDEDDERFSLLLGSARGDELVIRQSPTGTIIDDDAALAVRAARRERRRGVNPVLRRGLTVGVVCSRRCSVQGTVRAGGRLLLRGTREGSGRVSVRMTTVSRRARRYLRRRRDPLEGEIRLSVTGGGRTVPLEIPVTLFPG